MPEITLPTAYRVQIKVFEHGWGVVVKDTKYFDNEDEAKAFVEKSNSKHNAPFFAEYTGVVT